MFENGTVAFEKHPKPQASAEKERIAALEQKIRRKDEVLGELMEEHVALKKLFGEFEGGVGSP